MADQNLNVQIFDQQGNPINSPGPGSTSPPPGVTPPDANTPSQPSSPNSQRQDRNQDSLDILQSVLGALSPLTNRFFGSPVTNLAQTSINAYRAYRNFTSTSADDPSAPSMPQPATTPSGSMPSTPNPTSTSPPSTPATPGGSIPATPPPTLPPGPTTVPGSPPGGSPPVPPGGPTPVPPVPPVPPGPATLMSMVGPAVAFTAAATAATIAFLYLKDVLNDTAKEVSRFHEGLAQATAEQRVQELMNKINMAQNMGNDFTELTRVQTETNKIWNDLKIDFYDAIAPFIIDGAKTLVLVLAVLRETMKVTYLIWKILDFIANSMVPGMKQLKDMLYRWIIGQDKKEKQLEHVRAMDKVLNPMLNDARNGIQPPNNRGVGFNG